MNYLPDDIVQRCCFCDRLFRGPGNNPAPVRKSGRCCNECYSVRVGKGSSRELFEPYEWIKVLAEGLKINGKNPVDILGGLRPIDGYLKTFDGTGREFQPAAIADEIRAKLTHRNEDTIHTAIHEAAHVILGWHAKDVVYGVRVGYDRRSNPDAGSAIGLGNNEMIGLLAGTVVNMSARCDEEIFSLKVDRLLDRRFWAEHPESSETEDLVRRLIGLYYRSARKCTRGKNPWRNPRAFLEQYQKEWELDQVDGGCVLSPSYYQELDEYKYVAEAMPCEEDDFFELLHEHFRTICNVLGTHFGTLMLLAAALTNGDEERHRLYPSDLMWVKSEFFDRETLEAFEKCPGNGPPPPAASPLARIVTEARTGVESGAVRAALNKGLRLGGWAPLALSETAEAAPRDVLEAFQNWTGKSSSGRTEPNIVETDGTIVLAFDWKTMNSGATKKAMDLAKKHGKPLATILLDENSQLWGINRNHIALATRFIRKNNVRNLNVVGPLESRQPRVEKAAKEFMEAVIDAIRLT